MLVTFLVTKFVYTLCLSTSLPEWRSKTALKEDGNLFIMNQNEKVTKLAKVGYKELVPPRSPPVLSQESLTE